MNKIRKGDEVIVLPVATKGKRGTVTLRKDDSHLVIEGINLVKSTSSQPHEGHHRRYRGKGHAHPPVQRGIFNAATGKADRVGIKTRRPTARACACSSPGAEIKAA